MVWRMSSDSLSSNSMERMPAFPFSSVICLEKSCNPLIVLCMASIDKMQPTPSVDRTVTVAKMVRNFKRMDRTQSRNCHVSSVARPFTHYTRCAVYPIESIFTCRGYYQQLFMVGVVHAIPILVGWGLNELFCPFQHDHG